MCHFLAGILYLILTSYTLVVQSKNGTKVKTEKDLKDYDWDVLCKFQPNAFACKQSGGSRFYYDTKMEDCKTFLYGGCPTYFNSFNTLRECHEHCRQPGQHTINVNLTDKATCRLQPEFGRCQEYHPMWYFDISLRVCRGFSFSGCGGNNNRFPNAQVCTAVCASITDF